MEKQPFVSVIMPVYNAECYLKKSIESVLNQTFKDVELILVNDCSKDNSAQICQEYAALDSRVKFVNLTENIGAGRARNQGIDVATGTYLTFVDSDDEIEADLYEKAVNATDNGKMDIVVWGVTEQYYENDGQLYSENKLFLENKNCTEEKEVSEIVFLLEKKTILGYQWNKFYKKSIVDKNNIRFEKAVLYEDYFFTMNVIEHVQSLAVIDYAGYYYNKRVNQSVTHQFVKEYFELSKRRVETMLQYVKSRQLEKEALNTLGNIYLRYILSGIMRNCDKRSGMNKKQMKLWVEELKSDQLYQEISADCKVESKALKILQILINKKMSGPAVFMGKMVYITKSYGGRIFTAFTKPR